MRGRSRNIGRRSGRFSSGAAWLPFSLDDLLAWWKLRQTDSMSDASGVIPCNDGDGVSVQVSRTGVNLSQATAGKRPTFHTGTPSFATFDAGDDFGSWATGSPSGLFSFHRFKTTANGYHNLYDNTSLMGVMLWIDSNNKLEPDATPEFSTCPIVTDGEWHTVFVWRSASVATRMWVDGTEIAPDHATSVQTVPANLDLFYRSSAGSNFNGSISEFGFANSLQTADTLAKLQSYLTS